MHSKMSFSIDFLVSINNTAIIHSQEMQSVDWDQHNYWPRVTLVANTAYQHSKCTKNINICLHKCLHLEVAFPISAYLLSLVHNILLVMWLEVHVNTCCNTRTETTFYSCNVMHCDEHPNRFKYTFGCNMLQAKIHSRSSIHIYLNHNVQPRLSNSFTIITLSLLSTVYKYHPHHAISLPSIVQLTCYR